MTSKFRRDQLCKSGTESMVTFIKAPHSTRGYCTTCHVKSTGKFMRDSRVIKLRRQVPPKHVSSVRVEGVPSFLQVFLRRLPPLAATFAVVKILQRSFQVCLVPSSKPCLHYQKRREPSWKFLCARLEGTFAPPTNQPPPPLFLEQDH